MNITAITIENFKCIRDRIRIDLKPITLLFGANSAGKSTIIQAIHYAWEVLGKHNSDPNFTTYGGRTVDLGGFENMVHGHDKSRSISMRFDMDHVRLSEYVDPETIALPRSFSVYKSQSVPRRNMPRDVSVWLEFRVSWSNVFNAPHVSSYSVGINEEPMAAIRSSEDGRTEVSHINFLHPLLYDRNACLKKELDSYFSGEHTQLNDTVHIFLEAVIKAFRPSESGSDPSAFPETVRSAAESLRNMAEGGIGLPEHFPELSKDDIREIREPILPWARAIEKFAALSFWLFCREFFGVKTLDGNVNIECPDQEDALPKPVKRLNLRHDNKKAASYKWDFEAVAAVLTQSLAGPCQVLADALCKFRYVGPVRTRIPRNYVPNRFADERGWADGIAAWDVLHKGDREFVEQVSKWMSERLSCGYRLRRRLYKEVDLEDDLIRNSDSARIRNMRSRNMRSEIDKLPTKSQLLLTDEKSGIDVYIPDVGVGITQVLPVVVAVLCEGAEMLAIEQPELHIHPALQVSLGDLFISEIAGNDKIFIIETHSEHLMLRFLRRIRETTDNEVPADAPELRPEQIAVYYAESGENGVSLSQIRIDEDGDFTDRWPRGFFSERVRELYS